MNDEVILDEPQVFLTRKKVSEILGVSVRTVDRIKERGLLRTKDWVGNVQLFSAEQVRDLQEYFARKEWYRDGGEADEAE